PETNYLTNLKFFTMKFLSILFLSSFLSFFGENSKTNEEKIESIIIQCGNDPDGNYGCVHMIFNDGSNCLVIDDETHPNGPHFYGDCEPHNP
ncbi:MAG TPA: hypothetical protein PKD85_15230, partial [Saprospiraceae bacterium]|nr:hypothetical protein [Saprospiraceae bacterium]